MVSLLFGLALASPPSIQEPLRTDAQRPGDAAMVIGIERYPFLPDVRHAYRDADAVNNLFVYTMGIPAERVTLLKGGTREQIQRSIQRGAEAVGEGGRLWVYFAGHGAATPQGEPLLVADDARQDIEVFLARSVPITALTRGLSVPTTILLDACWTGRSRDGEELVAGSRFTVPVWALQRQEDVQVWTGASVDQVSGPYEPARQGLFTYFFVGAVRGWADGELDGKPDGAVTAGEVQAYLRRILPAVQAHEQVPTFDGPASYEIIRASGLERGPNASELPALSGSETSVVGAPLLGPLRLRAPFQAPLVHQRGSNFVDARGRMVQYGQLQANFGELPTMARVDQDLSDAKAMTGFGAVLLSVGAAMILPGAGMLAANDGLTRGAGGAFIGIGSGIAIPGTILTRNGVRKQRIQRRQAAAIVNDQLADTQTSPR